jgi:hypothetical protein
MKADSPWRSKPECVMSCDYSQNIYRKYNPRAWSHCNLVAASPVTLQVKGPKKAIETDIRINQLATVQPRANDSGNWKFDVILNKILFRYHVGTSGNDSRFLNVRFDFQPNGSKHFTGGRACGSKAVQYKRVK